MHLCNVLCVANDRKISKCAKYSLPFGCLLVITINARTPTVDLGDEQKTTKKKTCNRALAKEAFVGSHADPILFCLDCDMSHGVVLVIIVQLDM